MFQATRPVGDASTAPGPRGAVAAYPVMQKCQKNRTEKIYVDNQADQFFRSNTR
jgi:hypothetical protein